MPERRVVLVRHALTEYDVAGPAGRFLGRSDPPLSQRGVEEARELREALVKCAFDSASVGAAKRCRQTLEILLEERNTPVTVDPLLAEIDYGVWEGLAKGAVAERFPDLWCRFEADPSSHVPPGGESVPGCQGRAVQWLCHVEGERTIAVVDKTWLRLLLCHVLGVPIRSYRDVMDVKIAGITVLLHTARGWRLEALNFSATGRRVFGAAL